MHPAVLAWHLPGIPKAVMDCLQLHFPTTWCVVEVLELS